MLIGIIILTLLLALRQLPLVALVVPWIQSVQTQIATFGPLIDMPNNLTQRAVPAEPSAEAVFAAGDRGTVFLFNVVLVPNLLPELEDEDETKYVKDKVESVPYTSDFVSSPLVVRLPLNRKEDVHDHLDSAKPDYDR